MITFTRTSYPSHDAASDAPGAPTLVTITGSAIQVRGRRDTYRALELIQSRAPSLLFAPTTYGQLPQPGDVVTWPAVGGSQYTVRDVEPIAPDGVAIMARVVIAQ